MPPVLKSIFIFRTWTPKLHWLLFCLLGKYGIEWPVCEGKPEERCEPVLKAPNKYVDDFERLLYVEKGDTISFKCAQEGYLAGDAAKLEYK